MASHLNCTCGYATGMCHSFILVLFFISFGAAACYGIMAGSTCGSLIGVGAGILALAIMLRIFTGSWVSNIHIITCDVSRFQNCGL
jgi:hypothetical protein